MSGASVSDIAGSAQTDRRRLQSQEVAEELNRRIVTGEIALGSWLRQETVTAMFDVSRTPVREAFRILAGQGVLEIVPRRGALVVGLTSRDIRESHEVRAVLEGFAAEAAASRAEREHLAALANSVDQFSAIASLANDATTEEEWKELGRRWVAANQQFHSAILDAADNSQLRKSIELLRSRVPHNTTFSAMGGNRHQIAANAADHCAIFEAIRDGKGEAARDLVSNQLLMASELIVRHVERDSPEALTNRRPK
jgi:DNA-binding GntR family transcriptional regulator